MIFSDSDILAAIKTGELEIDPFDQSNLNPNSYDLTLSVDGMKHLESRVSSNSGSFTRTDGVIDPFDKSTFRYSGALWDHLHGHNVTSIRPGQFMIASVRERTFFNGNLTGELTGKSSLARLGLMVHVTAGLGDAGWNGIYVLELYNVSGHTIRLREGMPIAQVVIQRTGIVLEPYGLKEKSKYQNQIAGQGSKYYLNERKD